MRLVRLLVLMAAVLAGTTGCVGSASPTRTPVYNQTDLVLGSGDEAVAGRALTVNYTGWIFDPLRPEQKGAVFDSSIGRAPFAFTLGAGNVIAGWERGVPGMRVGGFRRLLIPPSLGYGATRAGALPPYASLVFEIELLSVAAPAHASR
jgi:FKBP-type peptidyl-prolyl cis-trans isomerase